MATPVSYPKNLPSIRTEIAAGSGPKTLFFVLDPSKKVSIVVKKNDKSAKIETTNATKSVSATVTNGTPLTDLEDADVPFVTASDDILDYQANDTAGLSGIKITSTPVGADIEISILQY